MLTISYHSSSSDPFYNADAASRSSYYALQGYPTSWADGDTCLLGSWANVRQDSIELGRMYNYRRGFTSPLTITVTGRYNSSSRTGMVKATVTNTGGSQITNYKLRHVIVETVPYNWQWTDTCWEVCRKMLPNASGVTISLSPGQTVADSQNFTMGSGWVAAKTWMVSFVQNDGTKEVTQGGWSPLSSFSGAENQEISGPKESGLELAQNRPNPAKGSTEIAFSLQKAGDVRLAVYDIQGKLVRSLAEGARAAGTHRVSVSGLESGVYFYRLEAGRTSLTRRMVVTR
jgi:hypothetical protein